MTPISIQPRNRFLNFTLKHSHLMTWLVLFLLSNIIISRHSDWDESLVISTLTIAPMIITWAMLTYLMLPYLMPSRRMAYYFCCLVFLACMVITASAVDLATIRFCREHIWESTLERDGRLFEANRNINIFFLHAKYGFLLFATMTVSTISYLVDERKRQEAAFKEEQMQEELKYLRAQINPHFLFNALNCIYALTMTQDEKAPDSVLKLSEMLRYVIDDCRAEEVLLSKEVKYIQNYIDFQRIRMEHEPRLTFEVQQADPAYKIPPMILQPIIENCFKHSRLVDDANAWAHITIRQNESGLLFTCDNSKPAASQFSRQSAIIGREDEERTGIGLQNVQLRLNMLFDGKCSLKVIEDDEHYKTILHI